MMSGPNGTLEQLAPLGIARKMFIHIYNSNPVLRDDSPDRAAVEDAGCEVSYDGMEVTL
jgi:pyrroloquinoline quinone biosynthesis protein B